jgi:hypothetical protein
VLDVGQEDAPGTAASKFVFGIGLFAHVCTFSRTFSLEWSKLKFLLPLAF